MAAIERPNEEGYISVAVHRGDGSCDLPTATAVAVVGDAHTGVADVGIGGRPAPLDLAVVATPVTTDRDAVVDDRPPTTTALPATRFEGVVRRRPVATPEGTTVFREGDALVIRRRWYSRDVYRLLFFAAVWNGCVAFWNVSAIASGGPWGAALFFVLHDLAGLYLIYCIVLSLVNSTYVTVRGDAIAVESRPFRGCEAPASLDARRVVEIRCGRNARGGLGRVAGAYYGVRALDANGVETVIVGGLARAEEALFLEQELVNHLGLGAAAVAQCGKASMC